MTWDEAIASQKPLARNPLTGAAGIGADPSGITPRQDIFG